MSVVARTKARHHQLARHLAEGKDLLSASALARYTLVQAERLEKDLVFQELIYFYQEELRLEK